MTEVIRRDRMLGRRKEPEQERLEVAPTKTEVRVPMQQEPMSTILSSDTHFKGSLTFEKALKIEGSFEGEITTSGTLSIGKDAKVKAEIKAGSVYIEGTVTGNVVATEKIELRTSAKVNGDIRAAKLVVEEGAALAGRCEVSLKPEKSDKHEKDNGQKGFGDFLSKTPVETLTQGLK